MISIKVDTVKADRWLDKVHRKISVGTEDTIRNLTKVGTNLAQTLAPVDTGALRENITSRVETKGFTTIGVITSGSINGVNYNVFQEFGTGASGANNQIHPRARAGLKNPVDGISYNTEIAGFGAQPFMYPTYKYLSKKVGEDMSKMVKESVR